MLTYDQDAMCNGNFAHAHMLGDLEILRLVVYCMLEVTMAGQIGKD